MSATNATLTFAETNTMHIPNTKGAPNVCVINTNAGIARLTQPVEIPARSEMVVEVKISRQQHDKEVLLEPHGKLLGKKLGAAKCLVKLINRKGVLRIMNPQCFEVALPQNYIVAHVMEIEQNQVFPLDSRKGHQQNNSNFQQINEIAPENHKTNEIQFNLNNSDLDSAKKQILLEFWPNTEKTLLLI